MDFETFPILPDIQNVPHPLFADKDFYKTVLGEGGTAAKNLHDCIKGFLTETDNEKKTEYRRKIINIYGDLIKHLVPQIVRTGKLDPLSLFVRYALISPQLISQDQIEKISTLELKNHYSDQPVYYTDEWFRGIFEQRLPPTQGDDYRPPKKKANGGEETPAFTPVFRSAPETGSAGLQETEAELKQLSQTRARREEKIRRLLPGLLSPSSSGSDPADPYPETRQKQLGEVIRDLEALQEENIRLEEKFKQLRRMKQEKAERSEQAAALRESSEPAGTGSLEEKELLAEVGFLNQMNKMSVGRRGNHFPLLIKSFFSNVQEIGSRENILRYLHQIESVDPELFLRTYKDEVNRVVPFFILLPNYGHFGICWEPFERFNRRTSRGRIALPMYSPNLKMALIVALADYRWQFAKERNSQRWLEDGLTGAYYQWMVSQKLRGEPKQYFIKDYLLWISKESEGIQKLDKKVRGIFWRHLPFSPERKEILKKRSPVYAELHKKDINRSLSDGY